MTSYRHNYTYIEIQPPDNTPEIILHILNTYGSHGYKAIHIQHLPNTPFKAFLLQSQEVTYATHYHTEPLPSVTQLITQYKEQIKAHEETITVIDQMTGEEREIHFPHPITNFIEDADIEDYEQSLKEAQEEEEIHQAHRAQAVSDMFSKRNKGEITEEEWEEFIRRDAEEEQRRKQSTCTSCEARQIAMQKRAQEHREAVKKRIRESRKKL